MIEKSLAEIQAETAAVQLELAQIQLEKTKEEVAQWRGTKAVRSRQNRQRQGQLRSDLVERAQIIASCSHKQGGSPGRERKGEGPSALRVCIMPDERELIMCANCPLRVFSPLPADKGPDARPGESKADAKARVRRYYADLKEFEALKEESAKQLTPEAGQPMFCGKTFHFVGRSGNNLSMPAPCDSYAQGRDNRAVAPTERDPTHEAA